MKRMILIIGCLSLSACSDFVSYLTNAPTCDVSTLELGITFDKVVEQCGKPYKINMDSYGTDQWIYDYNSYIYIKDGKLKSWQTTKVVK